jgi:hypothetical protein
MHHEARFVDFGRIMRQSRQKKEKARWRWRRCDMKSEDWWCDGKLISNFSSKSRKENLELRNFAEGFELWVWKEFSEPKLQSFKKYKAWNF